MYDQFIAYIEQHNLVPSKSKTLLAISGGVDSMVLVHLFLKAQYPIAIAHANFGLRSQESDGDAQLVQALACKYNIPCHIAHFQTKTYATNNHLSIQMAARELRYHWFEELRQQAQYTSIATAHHHNDQIETFLHNITQGTSIAGLRGMRPARDHIIHPLLFATKQEILAYATQEQLTWREDSSNSSLHYNRNFLRHQVIPQLKKLNPGLEKTFHRTFSKIAQVEMLFLDSLSHWKGSVYHEHPPLYHITLAPIQKKPWGPIALHHWLAPFGFTFEQINTWWQDPPQTGKKHLSPTHWLLAERGRWIVGPHEQEKPKPSYTITTLPTKINLTSNKKCTIEAPTPYNGSIPQDRNSALLDYDKLTKPLTLRPWKKGDIFVPLGMKNQHKKISDYLIDNKVPSHKKGNIYLLIAGEEVAWIVGMQISDLFKVTSATQRTILCKQQTTTTKVLDTTKKTKR